MVYLGATPINYAVQDDEDEDEKPPVPKRTTSRTASAQQILQAIKQQQKSTTLTSITATSTTLPSGIVSSTANIEMKRFVEQQPPSQTKQIVGMCQTTGLGILNTSGKYSHKSSNVGRCNVNQFPVL